MGRIGKNIKSFIAKLSGSSTDAQFSSVEEFAGDQRTVQVFGPCNEDFAPPENVKTLNIPLGRGRGFLISAAYHNQEIAPVAIHGERRIYSTNQAGDTVVAEVFLKQDGTILIKNDAVTITANPSGKLEIETDENAEITSIEDTIIINKNTTITSSVKATFTTPLFIALSAIVQLGTGTVRSLIDSRFAVLFNAHVHSGVTAGGANTGTSTTSVGAGHQTTNTKAS